MNSSTVDRIHKKIHSLVTEADNYLDEQFSPQGPKDDFRERAAWCIESAFIRLISLSESVGLPEQTEIIKETYRVAKQTGLGRCENWQAEMAWSAWNPPIRLWANVTHELFGSTDGFENDTSRLLHLIKQTQNVINNKNCFAPPRNESEVHDRIEMVLKAVYPDTLRKPPISGTVKSFIPDSGIPSLQTLIEYKFLDNEKQAPIIADEILADVSGYRRENWRNVVFVIYETRRFKSESDWQEMLRERGINDTVILIHGEPRE